MRPNFRPGQPRRYGHKLYTPDVVRSLHRVGVLSELAFARYYGLDFEEEYEPDRGKGDVAGRQVRSTSCRTGCLRMHDHDASDQPYYLVIRRHGDTSFRIAGWLMGAEAKRVGYRCEPESGRPCIMVPQAKLRMPPLPRGRGMILRAA